MDAVVQAENEKAKAAKMEKLSKPRLVADPSVSAKEIMGAIRNFVNVKETKDLYSLVAPGGFRTMSWQSQVDSDWLLKVAALCYDILEFAPNSKLQGKKVSEFASDLGLFINLGLNFALAFFLAFCLASLLAGFFRLIVL